MQNMDQIYRMGLSLKMSEEVYKRVELTGKQKEWVKAFWTWVGITKYGFKTPAIPDLIPRFTCDGRTLYVPAIEPHLHHVNPIGTSTRVDHNPNYNVPQNIVPVSASYHVGKGVRPGDPIEGDVVHPDQMEFLWEYGEWKRNNMEGESPMDRLQRHRRELTAAGRPYHNTQWDGHFREQIRENLDEYAHKHPWPLRLIRVKKGSE